MAGTLDSSDSHLSQMENSDTKSNAAATTAAAAPTAPPHLIGVIQRFRSRPQNSSRTSQMPQRLPSSSGISGPRPLNDHLRSVSLPQALHSFTISQTRSRPAATKRSRGHLNSANADSTTEEEEELQDQSSFLQLPQIARFSAHNEYLENEPVSPTDVMDPRSAKRTISDGSSCFTGNRFSMSRSNTSPKLASHNCPSDTEYFDQHFIGKLTPKAHTESPTFELHSARGATHRALSNPDILRGIFEEMDQMVIVPHEPAQQRRKPNIQRRAHTTTFGASKTPLDTPKHSAESTQTPMPTDKGLYSCLLVNSVWYDVAVRVLERQVHFSDSERWTQFARRGAAALTRKPRKLVLHKLEEAIQMEIDLIENCELGEQLEWLEFYTCAKISPNPSLLGPQLTKIILPGCFQVSDYTMARIAEKCPQLRHLDIRACQLVTDRGIKLIAKYCPQLELLNVGRTQGGEHITYKGVKHLARQTKLSTLGVAGCHVDDRAVWELALNRGDELERLSLNNCVFLTDYGIPKALGYMPNLTVLEIKGCIQIHNMRPLALFKTYRERQGQQPLIEGCEVIEYRLQQAITRLHNDRSHRIRQDLEKWINKYESDLPETYTVV